MSNFTPGITWASGVVVTPTKLKDFLEDGTLSSAYLTTLSALFTPRGYVFGLTLANNGSDANNDIDIAAGSAKSDDNAALITLASGITKRSDAPWAVGSTNGGMDTGSKPTSGTLHVWLISNGTVVDALFSTSATAPTMPGGYTLKRRIGSVLTDGSANIRGFVQHGDRFILKTRAQDADQLSVPTTASLVTLSVPAGLKFVAITTASLYGTGNEMVLVTSPDETDQAPSSGLSRKGDVMYLATGEGFNEIQRLTNTSAQIRVRAETTGATLNLQTSGWIDSRGRDT